jgi:DNA (cytosine-5)-methyltransferase 1
LARGVASLFNPGNVVDLFSGAGGLSEGFVQAGHEILLASDFNSHMCRTYAYNHQTTEVVQADLHVDAHLTDLLESIERKLTGQQLNALIGGPPCQGFSTAGNRNTSDLRNLLVFRMLDLVRILAPNIVVIENVPGLKWMQQGQILYSIVENLRNQEYYVTVLNLQAEEFGVPQRRRRVFVIGHRDEECVETPRGLLAPLVRGRTRTDISLGCQNLPPPVSVSEAISDLPPINSGGGEDLIEYDKNWIHSDYQRFLRDSLSFDDFITKRAEQG